MKCLYIYLITVTAAFKVISAAVPKDLCETCVPTQDCPLFENLNISDQLIWMEEFPCGSYLKNDELEVPPGFASAAKGDYVCCSNNIWGVEKTERYKPRLSQEPKIDLRHNRPSNHNNYYSYNKKKSDGPGYNNHNNKNSRGRTHDNNYYPYNYAKLANSPKTGQFNNYYYNKHNHSRNRRNNNNEFNDIIDPLNHNLDDYNSNANSNYDSQPTSSTVWHPDRSRNYDNTDYWQTQDPKNNGSSNESGYWNDGPNQDQNIENMQRPPGNEARSPNQYNIFETTSNLTDRNTLPPNIDRPTIQYDSSENEAIQPVGDNLPGNAVRLPIQYEPPGNIARLPTQYNPPGNNARPPIQNYPPGNLARPPNQYDPPENNVRPPIQDYPPGNMARPPNQYNPPGNNPRQPVQNYPPGNVGRPPNQYNPPGNDARPPIQNYPPGNIVRPPNQYDPPGNNARPPVQNYPPGNIVRPPNQYNPPGNDARPVQNYPPGNIARPPNQYDPPGNDARPPVQNYPPGNIARPPNQYNPPGNDPMPPVQNYPPGNIARPPNQYDPPGNDARPPVQNYPPGNIASPPNRYYPPGIDTKPPVQNYPPGNIARPPNQYEHPENNARPPVQNYPPGSIARPPNQYDPPGNIAKPPIQYDPPDNFGRPPTRFPPDNNNYMPGSPCTNKPWEPEYNNYDQGNRRNGNNYYDYDNNNPNYGGNPNNSFNNYPGSFGGGQCSLTSFPPDPQSECCGRQLADDDRIAGWNNKPSSNTNLETESTRSGPIWRNRRSVSDNDTEVTIENRISGGHATELYQYPWTVLLLTTFDYGNREASFNCGGGLISTKYVLTAGHCVYDQGASVKSVQVNLAEYDKNSFPKDCKSTRNGRRCIDNVVMYVDEITTHPQYENENLVNDIALLRLRGSAPYTEYIRPICLPTINIDDAQYSNLQFEVAGWGRIGTYSSNIKQSTVLHLVDHNQCKQYYPQLTNKHLCAAGKKNEDTCKGDSGGPLMALYRGKYFVTGIVSGKRADSPCGTTVPSLYTNVYHYVDWIRSIIRN